MDTAMLSRTRAITRKTRNSGRTKRAHCPQPTWAVASRTSRPLEVGVIRLVRPLPSRNA
ncbi:hypothetical protein D3C80_2041580 [compost metagenome]